MAGVGLKRRAVLALLAGLGLAGGVWGAEDAMPESETDAVLDAVFRALLVEAEPPPGEVVCVVVRTRVGGKEQLGDPSEALLERLRKARPNARKASACSRTVGEPTTDAASGADAVVLDMGPVDWRDDSTAVTEAGFSRGGYGSFEWKYELARRDGRWTVTRATRGHVI